MGVEQPGRAQHQGGLGAMSGQAWVQGHAPVGPKNDRREEHCERKGSCHMHVGEKEDGRRQKQRGRQGDTLCEQGATETIDACKG